MPQPTLRPYLKWAGGKRQLLPEIRARLPENMGQRNYYEPFVGAGAVLFDLHPGRAVINDFNSQLMLTYRAIRDHVEEVIALLEEHQANHSREYYYQIRGADRTGAFQHWSQAAQAARLIYLNKTCFNGLYRVNGQGLFNVPFGSYKRPAICEPQVLRAVSAYLSGNAITLLCGDFADAVATAQPGDFVYFDPPYHSADNTNFTGYQAGGFGEEEQRRLRDLFVQLAGRGVLCMLSNSDTQFIRTLYQNYDISILPARRAINARPEGRGAVNEVLVRSW